MESQADLLTVLEVGIEALAGADAGRLAELVEVAWTIQAPETREERFEALRLHHTLGCLLVLTRRNLRLLGAASGTGQALATGLALAGRPLAGRASQARPLAMGQRWAMPGGCAERE